MTVIKDPTPKSRLSTFHDDQIRNENIFGDFRFPFTTKLSFVPLLRHWEGLVKSGHPTQTFIAKEIKRLIQEAPALQKAINNSKILERYPELVNLMLAPLFPAAPGVASLGRVFKPMDLRSIYRTPGFDALINEAPYERFILNRAPEECIANSIYASYCLVLNAHYGYQLPIENNYNISVQLANSGLIRHYKCVNNLNFMDVVVVKPLPKLKDRQIQDLLSTPLDHEKWLQAIPPDHFEFHGIIADTMTDITEEMSISQLKNQLLHKSAFGGRQRIEELEQSLRSYLALPDLRLGLSALDDSGSLCLAYKYQIEYLLFANEMEADNPFLQEGSIYNKVLSSKKPLLLQDISQYEDPTKAEVALINDGYRSVLAYPLLNKNQELIGLLEIASGETMAINDLKAMKIAEIIPLFEMAILRRREELDNQIEAIIREKYTSLHPSVEWKFIENAYYIWQDRMEQRGESLPQNISFKKVSPFYGQSDIVSSTTLRNQAVQADLEENLKMAYDLLKDCNEQTPLPVLDQFLFKINQQLVGLKQDFTSARESKLVEFMHIELHPLLTQLAADIPILKQRIDTYFKALDSTSGVLYNRRRDYEKSVAMINDALVRRLQKEQESAQKLVPHYFEKYKTDGIEFDMYAGQSLLRTGTFSNLQLKNLRIWQLTALCKLTRETALIRPKLPVPLETAQMIFVYGNAIDIHFRMDEKRFDVDGAYNIRYEIIKKRIDKAVIAETNERLRSPGSISIVYTNDNDRKEYLEYLEFLSAKGWLEEEIEDLTLAKLQGVEGLRALRVKVNVELVTNN
ncbi:MAG: hypothetical protein KTR30_17280 [Saprospiraceae bacterium]|nr:hypothetical protein [Saprospiraceae bacterium]